MENKTEQDDVAYGKFVNTVISEANFQFGRVNMDKVIKKYERMFGSDIYNFVERMKSETRIQYTGKGDMYNVPFSPVQIEKVFTPSNNEPSLKTKI